MKPKAPAIVIYHPESMVWMAWTDADLMWHLGNIQIGGSLEVMDAQGAIYVVNTDSGGSPVIKMNGFDVEKMKRMLLALAGGESNFDPSELIGSDTPEEMFTAYAGQI